MQQPINFTETDLDELAEQASELRTWLEDKATRVGMHAMLPSTTTMVGSIVLSAGLSLVMDDLVPDTACWGGFGGSGGSCLK